MLFVILYPLASLGMGADVMAFLLGVTTSLATRSPDMTSSIQAVAGAGLLALKVIPRLHPLTQPGPALVSQKSGLGH